jgi:hypothetical protein
VKAAAGMNGGTMQKILWRVLISLVLVSVFFSLWGPALVGLR